MTIEIIEIIEIIGIIEIIEILLPVVMKCCAGSV